MIPAENKLKWSEDGERLFFGFKPLDECADLFGRVGRNPFRPEKFFGFIRGQRPNGQIEPAVQIFPESVNQIGTTGNILPAAL